MATITIKIESEQLAREVLTQLGYLADDISVESEEEEPEALIHDHMADLLPKGTRKMPDTQKQSEFCTTEEPKEDVEPVENELGASLDVFSDETAKERDALYQQSLEVHKSLPSAEERLKATADHLIGDELLDYLDAMCDDHNDKYTREAAKAMVRKEFTGHTLKMWPSLQKVLDSV